MDFTGRLFYGNTIHTSQFVVNSSGYLEVIAPVTGSFGMSVSFVYASAS